MNLSPLVILIVLAGVWFFLLRTRATSLVSRKQFEEIVRTGEPTVVGFFSNT